MELPKKSIRMLCPSCCRFRIGTLIRGKATIQGYEVPDVLSYRCRSCNIVLATPAISSGRVFPYVYKTEMVSLHLPKEAEDLAYCVNAAVGAIHPMTIGGGLYSIPLRLGLSASSKWILMPKDWAALDRCKRATRYEGQLSRETVKRMEGLRKEWGGSLSTVACRLLVAAHEFVLGKSDT